MRALLTLSLVALLTGPTLADPPARPSPPPKPGFTTGRTPGFTTGRMPGFTTGPITDPRAGYPVCSAEAPCVLIVDDDTAFHDDPRPVDEELGTLPGDR